MIPNNAIASVAVIVLATGVLPASAGCYSDWCAGQSSGAATANRTLKYGGTYGQAGADALNYGRGYGTSGGSGGYYSPYANGMPPPGYYPPQQISPQQRQEIERLKRQTDTLINQIYNDPRIWH